MSQAKTLSAFLMYFASRSWGSDTQPSSRHLLLTVDVKPAALRWSLCRFYCSLS